MPVDPSACALTAPAKLVAELAVMVTTPPSPETSASALIVVAGSMVTVCLGPGAAGLPTGEPARIDTWPPPAAPLAFTRAPLRTMVLPVIAMLPPAALADVAVALPVTRVVPSPPSSTTTPPSR